MIILRLVQVRVRSIVRFESGKADDTALEKLGLRAMMVVENGDGYRNELVDVVTEIVCIINVHRLFDILLKDMSL